MENSNQKKKCIKVQKSSKKIPKSSKKIQKNKTKKDSESGM